MKACSFIPILWLVTLTFAGPPVGDGYPSTRLSHDQQYNDQHASDHHPSQEYGPPSSGTARDAPSDGYNYNAPNARSSSSTKQSRFPPATVRVSFNQRFSSAAARNIGNARRQPEHSASITRSGISQEYGAPASRALFQEYGAPSVVSSRTLSTEHGLPEVRSTLSQEYGAPVVNARSNQQSYSQSKPRSALPQLSHTRSSPVSKSQFQSDSVSVDASPTARSNDAFKSYEAPKSNFGSRSAPSSSEGTHSSRNSGSHDFLSARNINSQDVDSVSQTYGAPNQRGIDETYGAPNARSLSQEYGAPSSRANLMTSAVPSSFASTRSSPSSSYLPASRSAAPSEQYGVPQQQDSSAQGYDYARARALKELQNQEPASYDFGYQIEDQESGSDFGHTETREADRAQGSYFVVRPDGTKQTVEYEADEGGYRPRISVEAADAASARAGGYDDNAQDASSAQGPY